MYRFIKYRSKTLLYSNSKNLPKTNPFVGRVRLWAKRCNHFGKIPCSSFYQIGYEVYCVPALQRINFYNGTAKKFWYIALQLFNITPKNTFCERLFLGYLLIKLEVFRPPVKNRNFFYRLVNKGFIVL